MTTDSLQAALDAIAHPSAGLEWSLPWRVVPCDGKPTIASNHGGNLFRGFIGTWKEADLIVAVVNALPDLLRASTDAAPVAWMYRRNDGYVDVRTDRLPARMPPWDKKWTETPLYAHPPVPDAAPVAGALQQLAVYLHNISVSLPGNAMPCCSAYIRDAQKLIEQTLLSGEESAAEERDALLAALGWKKGPFRDEAVRKVILDDSAGLRPAMVDARRRADDASADRDIWRMIAGERVEDARSGLLIRVWNQMKDERRRRIKAEAALAHPPVPDAAGEVSPIDIATEAFNAFMDDAVSNAPEPLRKLGEYLARLLDEDQWKTSEQYLNAAALAQPPAAEPLREAVQHLLEVGEFCRTDETESALRKVRAALATGNGGEGRS